MLWIAVSLTIFCGVVSVVVGEGHAELCRTIYIVTPSCTSEVIESEPTGCGCKASDRPWTVAVDWHQVFTVITEQSSQKLAAAAAGDRSQTQTARMDECNFQRQNCCKEETEK